MPRPRLTVHICQPRDTTRTLCDLPAARVAAINFSERVLAHGTLCPLCLAEAEREDAARHGDRDA